MKKSFNLKYFCKLNCSLPTNEHSGQHNKKFDTHNFSTNNHQTYMQNFVGAGKQAIKNKTDRQTEH